MVQLFKYLFIFFMYVYYFFSVFFLDKKILVMFLVNSELNFKNLNILV